MKLDKAWRRWLRHEQRRATRLIHNPAGVIRVAAAVDHKAQHATGARGPLAQVWDDLQTSVRLIRAWGRREYRGVGRGTLVLIVGALLYFVSPIDAIVSVTKQYVGGPTVYQSERDDWILAMAAAGLGYAFMPALCVDHPGVVALPLVEPEIWREIALVTVRGRPHSPGVGALMHEAMHLSWLGKPALAVVAARGASPA